MAQSAPEDKAVRIRIDQSTGSVSLSEAEASDLAESAQQADPKADLAGKINPTISCDSTSVASSAELFQR